MSAFDAIFGMFFEAFCNPIGCGGSAGLALVGLVVFTFIMFLCYKIDLGMDGTIVVGSVTILALAGGGLIPNWINGLPWIGIMALIALGIYRVVSR